MSRPLDFVLAPAAALRDRGDAWVVGGAIRDALLGHEVDDIDLVVAGDARAAAAQVAEAHGAGRFRLSADFGSWRVHGGRLGEVTVDLTPVQGADLSEDLGRRDFTVNAMALPVGDGALIDPYGGRDDLQQRRLRLVSDRSLQADPVRVMRLARLERQLGLEADDATVARARADAPLLDRSAPERVFEELARMVRLGRPERGFAALDRIGALSVLVPELDDARGMEQNPYHHEDVFGHVMEVVERTGEITADPEPVFRSLAPRVAERLGEPLADDLTRGEALALAALFHDVAKPATRAVTPAGRVTFMDHDRLGAEMVERWCAHYRTSRRLREFIAGCVRQHLALGFLVHRQPLSLRQIDRYLRAVDPEQVELSVLTAADRLATRGPRTRRSAIDRHLALVREVTAVHFRLVDRGPVELPADGAQIARALRKDPGPWLKDLLVLLREEALLGRVTTADQAIAFARTWVLRTQMGDSD
jgi:poly(A) polymerase